MKIAAMVSSASNHWCSPPDFLDVVRRFDAIGLDPCSNYASVVDADVEWSLESGFDGLVLPWTAHGLVYVNPPYSRFLAPWIRKVCDEADAGAEIVTLTPSRTGSSWCQTLLRRSDAHCFLKGRLRFLGTRQPLIDGKPIDWTTLAMRDLDELARMSLAVLEPAPFDCVVGYFGRRAARFARAFHAMGLVDVHLRRLRPARAEAA